MPSNPSKSEVFEAAQESIAAHDSFTDFLSALAHSGHCARPVRLVGSQLAVDTRTGEARPVFSSDDVADGVVLKACGNRRASVCPACAAIYRGDARHLVGAGLAGGKGVATSIETHPAVFLTLTAPSFGRVHQRTDDSRCHPGLSAARCEHGRPKTCGAAHKSHTHDVVGQPLCAECYRYGEHILWHALASELWRRTAVYLPRTLARLIGMTAAEGRATFRLSFAKVVEYQARGAIHMHAVIRGDAPDGTPPPPLVTAEVIGQAAAHAARTVSLAYPIPLVGDVRRARWGTQLDVSPIDGPEAGRRAASYIAKYTTKSTEVSGGLDHRLRAGDLAQLEARGVSEHHQRLVTTAWQLGTHPELASLGLRRWAHAFGFRGHWLTKSAYYSTTFKALRDARAAHRALTDSGESCDGPDRIDTSHLIGDWSFAGVGHLTPADEILAVALYRTRQHTRRIAWEELTSGPPVDRSAP